MIRRIAAADAPVILPYLHRNPAMNLFIIGDLEAFGFDSDVQDLWVNFDNDGNIQSLLFRFFRHYIVYSETTFDPAPYVSLLERDPDFGLLQGDARAVRQFVANSGMTFVSERTTFMAQLTALSAAAETIDTSAVKQADLGDLDRILTLRGQIESFTNTPDARESLLKSMKAGGSRTFYIEDASSRMVAAASTAAENSSSAMVVGVCALPEVRRQGLASACTTALCKEILGQGKSLCLFYDNPEAGSIYLRLGFEHIGQWLMLQPDRTARP